MKFVEPYYFLLLPLLLLLPLWGRKKVASSHVRFSMAGWVPSSSLPRTLRIRRMLNALLYPILALLVLAMARPQVIQGGDKTPSEGIDMVLVVDISGSMKTLDVLPPELRPPDQIHNDRYQDMENRLSKVKRVARNFIADRKNDRIGVVAFAGKSVIISPLTNDYKLLDKLLEGLNFELITDGTAVGNALASAVTILKESERKSKAILMLTDGLNNAGHIEPAQGSYFAKSYGIRFYPIEMGSFVQNRLALEQGQQDADILTKMALLTGGQHFIIPTADYLYGVYSEIERIEKTRMEDRGLPDYVDLFPALLAAVMTLLVARFVLLNTRYRTLP